MKEVIVRIRDDIDGSEGAETIEFGIRGVSYEIDLSAANVELFDKSLAQFVEVARRVVSERAPAKAARQTRQTRQTPVSNQVKDKRREIRDWANDNGFQVDARGMIAQAVIEAYEAANPGVKLHPDVWPRYHRSGPRRDTVDSQELIAVAKDGEVVVSDLFTPQPQPHHQSRDRSHEVRTRGRRARIRTWANENGFDQAPTGMIKQEVLDAYSKAHPEDSE